jgi:hypothetical protein
MVRLALKSIIYKIYMSNDVTIHADCNLKKFEFNYFEARSLPFFNLDLLTIQCAILKWK